MGHRVTTAQRGYRPCPSADTVRAGPRILSRLQREHVFLTPYPELQARHGL
jgi:hypothetical protein